MNKDYDGKIDVTEIVDGERVIKVGAGGTNPIFGVDGSAVTHDVFTTGYM